MSIRSLFVFFFFCARVPAPSRADKFGPDIRHWRRVCPRMWAVMRLMGLGLFLGGVFRGYLFFFPSDQVMFIILFNYFINPL